MGHFSDIGAAVIGSGFIGTVHIESLRRLGVHVRGVLAAARSAASRRPRATRPAARPTHRSRRCSTTPAVDVVHVTSPNQLHYPQVKADPGRRPARHLREAARRDLRRVARSWCAWRRPPTASPRSTSTSASTRSTSTPTRWSRDGALGEPRLITGHYFQDWLLLRHRLELAPGARQGRQPAGRRRHRLALDRPHQLHQRAAGRSRSWPTSSTFVKVRQQPTGPVETFSQERATRHHPDGR